MAGNRKADAAVKCTQGSVIPDIPDDRTRRKAHRRKIGGDLLPVDRSAIEQCDGDIAAGEWFGPALQWSMARNSRSLSAKAILIDGQHFDIRQQ